VRIAVLCNPGSWYLNDLSRAAAARGHECLGTRFPEMIGRIRTPAISESVSDLTQAIHAADAVIVRTMPPGSLEQVVFRMDALARLTANGTTVLNAPRAIECAVDKYLSTARLQAEGIPVPPTIVCESADAALAAFEELGGDVVVKPLFGAEGRGIMRVSHPELALRTFRTLERSMAVIYLQAFVDHGGFDDRILLLDGDVIGGMRRRARDDFRTNISQQGLAEAWNPGNDEIDLARRAARATGTCLAGVDLVRDPDGQLFVLEVNAVPGWRALARVAQVDVARRVITWIESQTDGLVKATG